MKKRTYPSFPHEMCAVMRTLMIAYYMGATDKELRRTCNKLYKHCSYAPFRKLVKVWRNDKRVTQLILDVYAEMGTEVFQATTGNQDVQEA